MGILYESPRQTGDVDVTSTAKPAQVDLTDFAERFDHHLSVVARRIGQLDLLFRVQSIKEQPKKEGLKEARFPGIKLSVGYARRDDEAGVKRFEKGQAISTIRVDVSFNEPVGKSQVLMLGEGGVEIKAYSIFDLAAEKYRAFLQQEVRNRSRRQDVFDLFYLIDSFDFDDDERGVLLEVLVEKSRARDLEISRDSISNDKLVQRAKAEWDTMELEIGDELPNFEECFLVVEQFYKSLPWGE